MVGGIQTRENLPREGYGYFLVKHILFLSWTVMAPTTTPKNGSQFFRYMMFFFISHTICILNLEFGLIDCKAILHQIIQHLLIEQF